PHRADLSSDRRPVRPEDRGGSSGYRRDADRSGVGWPAQDQGGIGGARGAALLQIDQRRNCPGYDQYASSIALSSLDDDEARQWLRARAASPLTARLRPPDGLRSPAARSA